MAQTERADPAWVAHEMNTVLVHLAEKLGLEAGPLKSTLKKVAGEWSQQPSAAGCPQDAYLAFCVRQAALAALFSEPLEPVLRTAGENDARVVLVRAITNEAQRGNDWSSLQNDLWATLDKPGLSAPETDEITAKLEVLESERVLVDFAGGGLTALRPVKDGPWPVWHADASACRKVADDLLEWLEKRVGEL